MPTLVELDTPLTSGQPAYGCTHMAVWWSLFRRLAAQNGYAPRIVQAAGDATDSAGTHLQGTALDLDIADVGLALLAREAGAPAAWPRGAAWGQSYWGDHLHLVIDCPDNTTLSARYQIDAVQAGYDGLGAAGHGGPDYVPAPSAWRTVDQGIAWMQAGTGLPVTTAYGMWCGERVGLADGAQITEGSPWIGPAFARGGGYITLATGDQIMGMCWDTLTWDGDPVTVSWIIRARGAGTLTITDAVDPDWSDSLPARPCGSIGIAGADWVEYAVPAGPGLLPGILADSSASIGITATSGTVDIDQVCLQAWPPGGPQGGVSVAVIDPVDTGGTNVTLRGSQIGGVTGQANLADAWAAAQAAADALPMVMPAGQAPGFSPPAAVSADYLVESGRDPETSWTTWWGTTILGWGAVAVSASPPAGDRTPPGVYGTDWVRRPDLTQWDTGLLSEPVTDPVIEWGTATVRVEHLTAREGYPAEAGFRVEVGPGVAVTTTGYPPVLVGDLTLSGGAAVAFIPSGTVDSGTDHTFDPPGGSSWLLLVRPMIDDGPHPGPWGDWVGLGVDAALVATDLAHVTYLGAPAVAVYPDGIRYWRPRWTWQPPTITAAPVTKLRQIQRDDALGRGPARWRRGSSRQGSNRQRGYR